MKRQAKSVHRRKRRKASQRSKNTGEEEHSETSSRSRSRSAAMDAADTDIEDIQTTHRRKRRKCSQPSKNTDDKVEHCRKSRPQSAAMDYHADTDFEEVAAPSAEVGDKDEGEATPTHGRERRKVAHEIDLSDVAPQPLICKSVGSVKEGTSKYTNVHFDKNKNKYRVMITIDGKRHLVGYYENEEEAAADYARAVFKYKGSCTKKALETNSSRLPRTRSCKAARLTAASSNDTYEVEEIVGYRRNNGQVEYLIKWIGYSKEENSWEPEENLNEVSLEEATVYREALETL